MNSEAGSVDETLPQPQNSGIEIRTIFHQFGARQYTIVSVSLANPFLLFLTKHAVNKHLRAFNASASRQ